MRCLKSLILLIFLFAPCVHARDAAPLPENAAIFETLEAREIMDLLASGKLDPVIIDVRTPAEYSQGHIKGARNINFFGPRFEDDIMKLPNNKAILLYCQSGRRSEAAAEILAKAGFSKVINLENGISAWKKASGKMVKE